MKTKEVLEQLRKENVRVPGNWAIMQSSSGVFLRFLAPDHDKRAREIRDSGVMLREALEERMRALMREAIKNSSLTEL